MSYREVPQENYMKQKSEISHTALAWAYKVEEDYADVFIYNKTPKNTKLKTYVQFGSAVKTKTSSDTVNDNLKTYSFSNAHDKERDYYLHRVTLNKNIARFAWADKSTKHIKKVWETRWGNNKHVISVTKVEVPPNMTELVFVYPTYMVTLEDHFEHNYHHFNYIFNPEKLPAGKRNIGTDYNLEI